MASNTVNPIQVGEVSDDLGLKVHGAIGDTIVDNLDCLADRSNQLCRKATIGDVSAVHFLHGDLHVLNEGQVNEGLSDGGQEGVARDGEGPLVHLEHKFFGAKFGSVVVRGLHSGGRFVGDFSSFL